LIRRRYLGLVVGRRFAGALFAVDLCAEAPAFARACVVALFFAAGFLPVVAVAPDATREECFTRCMVFFGAAASAIDDSAKAATSATTSIFIVLRTMRTSLRSEL